jgi:hypothetical protein
VTGKPAARPPRATGKLAAPPARDDYAGGVAPASDGEAAVRRDREG